MQNDFTVFIPFEKKNNDQQIVGGVASSEALDSQDEIVKYSGIKKALPDYMKFANIREMHQLSAVGKTIKAIPNDKTKELYIEAKVIDKNAWEKCKEGVYNGFSIGGKVLKQVGNEIQDLMLTEISLVDRPANPAAIFSLVKFEGGGNMKKQDTQEGMVMGDENASPMQTNPHADIYNARQILSLATELCYLHEIYMARGQDCGDIENAIETLEALAVKTLSDDTSEDAQKVFSVLDDFKKGNLDSKARNNLKDGDFAYIDSKGGRHLPMHDMAHVRNAMARFGQTQFESEEAKRAAAKKIIARATALGVKVDPNSSVASAAKAMLYSDIRSIVKADAWVNDYFTIQRQFLG